MAKETALSMFLDTDRTLVFTILDVTELIVTNITGWALSWMLKADKKDLDVRAALTKTTAAGIVISGTFNAVPATNTQVATVTLAAADTKPLAPGLWYYELKRTDAGFETVLAFGKFTLTRGVHHGSGL